MNEEQRKLIEYLKAAVENVYAENRFILQYETQVMKGLEQAFAFRVGLYLNDIIRQTEYNHLDLDAEYNKSIGLSKMTEEFENGIRPDLILHQRGSHDNNILAVEFKGSWSKIQLKDERKLIGLTSPAGDYKYKLGVFVQIGKTEANFRYFINGVEI